LFLDNGEVSCELRAATASDEPFLWEMLYLALFVPPGDPPLPRSVLRDPTIARYVDGWGTRSGDSGLIALVDSAPVGAAWLRCFPASDPGYGFVDERTPELSVAVLPAHRGMGIGSRLVEQLLQGVHATSLSCDPANPAWRLYVRLGFKPLPDGRTMLRLKSSKRVRPLLTPQCLGNS
jgi:GNAT superfamily N-acetyltransferase